MRKILFLSLFLSITSMVLAKMHTETVVYSAAGQTCKGYLAYDDALSGQRPGVLVVPEWWGLNDYPKRRAEQLAELGYIAFVADIYGNGDVMSTPEAARAKAVAFYGNRDSLRTRVNAGLSTLKANPLVDGARVAAIGYCFGGMTALELARSGADLVGVVSFHGSLSTPKPEDAKMIKGQVLVLTGADDPNVKADEITAFAAEMRNAGVKWNLVQYGGAVHAFTNPAAGNDPSKGVAYNADADRRSWKEMKMFFDEIFAIQK
jgi:dienelactone hydrolase